MKLNIRHIARLLLAGAVASAILTGEPQAVEIDFMQPPEPKAGGAVPNTGLQKKAADPGHYKRRGKVKLVDNAQALIPTILPGDHLKIGMFADKPYRIVIESQERDQFGGHKILGHIEGSPFQTFILTINQEDYVISLQDVASGNSYFISGKTGTGQGSVLEVDDRQKPRRFQ